jgi:maleate cis-trans isomerase
MAATHADEWERKLGLIVPSWNTVNEYEFQRVLLPAISVHSTRLRITADDEENFTRMAREVPGASQLLAQAKVQVICYGCLAGGFVNGPGHDQQIVRDIEAATGIPGVAAAAAVVDALRAIGATRISVASPYEAWLNERLKEYLSAFGIEVLAMKGLGTQAHAGFTPQQNAELASEVDRPESQAIFISCSNFRTLEIIEPLEEKLDKPVLTSNMSSLWKMLRVLGDRRCLPGAGRLFREA